MGKSSRSKQLRRLAPGNQLSRSDGHLASVTQTRTTNYVGPIPPAEVVQGWQRVLPDAPERVMRLAEDEAAHRRAIEVAEHDRIVRLTKDEMAIQKRGQLFGFILVITLVVGGFYFTSQGKDVGGVASLLAGAAFIIGYFVLGKRSDQKSVARP